MEFDAGSDLYRVCPIFLLHIPHHIAVHQELKRSSVLQGERPSGPVLRIEKPIFVKTADINCIGGSFVIETRLAAA